MSYKLIPPQPTVISRPVVGGVPITFGKLLLVSLLLGGGLRVIDISTDGILLEGSLAILIVVFMAAATVRAGYSLYTALLTGYSVSVIAVVHVWLVGWEPFVVDDSILDTYLVLGWLLWRESYLFLLLSTVGYGIGAVWLHHSEDTTSLTWIFPRVLLGLCLAGLAWLVWEFLIPTALPIGWGPNTPTAS